MKSALLSFSVFASVCFNVSCQDLTDSFRTARVNELKQLEITYKLPEQLYKGFFTISDTIIGKAKLTSSTCEFPFKFKDEKLIISGSNYAANTTLQFVFKTFEQNIIINGNVKFENYPNHEIISTFSKNEFILKKEKNKNEPIIESVVQNQNDTSRTGIKFRVQLAAAKSKMDVKLLAKQSGLSFAVVEENIDGYFKYTIGDERTLEAAKSILNRLDDKNFKKPFIVAYKDGIRIPIKQALNEINNKQ